LVGTGKKRTNQINLILGVFELDSTDFQACLENWRELQKSKAVCFFHVVLAC